MRTEPKSWTLTVIPERDIPRDRPIQCAADLPEGVGVTVPAQVPGNFELDLVRAGLLDDPFWGTNIVKLRNLEDRHLFYTATFDLPDLEAGELPVLTFEGIDTYASYFVNGVFCGLTDNMFMSYESPFLAPHHLKKTGNELFVHISPTMLVAQNTPTPPNAGTFLFNYASLHARKAPSSFGWDILCRAVSGGIWKPVYIKTVKAPALREVFLYTRAAQPSAENHNRGYAELNLYFACDLGGSTYYPFGTPQELPNAYSVTVEGVCGDSAFSQTQELWHTCGNLIVGIQNAKLWYPKNAGETNLYDVTVTLRRHGVVVDSRKLRTGIRTVELDRTSLAGDNGQFRFLINHRPVFALGTNWVPLDAFHSRDAERLPKALEMLDDIGCNTVRCWGGNVYESNEFFDFCDEHGILVWQDFAMGCAIYPIDEEMQDSLCREVEQVVKRLRNHPSLCLWAGDNECDLAWYGWHSIHRDPADNLLTRKIIPDVLKQQDFTRPYLPSSPYMDDTAYRAIAHPDDSFGCQGSAAAISEDHLWGPRDYFKGDYYRTTVCHFASETGYHGCPAPASLKSYIPENQLWPLFDEGTEDDPFRGRPNPAYFIHQTTMEQKNTGVFNYRIELMTNQVRHMFTDTPHDLATFAKMSQASQAEAFKYFIERFRVTKWRRTGIIWWNLLDGWPQVSDAVVNYDFTPKLAYFFIKRAQNPLHMTFTDPENGRITLTGLNDTQKAEAFTYTVKDVTGLPVGTDLATVPTLLTGSVTVPADGTAPAASLPAAGLDDRFLLIEWNDSQGDHKTHFLPEPQYLDSKTYFTALELCGFDDWYGFEE